jgi:chromosome segregation ATPase
MPSLHLFHHFDPEVVDLVRMLVRNTTILVHQGKKIMEDLSQLQAEAAGLRADVQEAADTMNAAADKIDALIAELESDQQPTIDEIVEELKAARGVLRGAEDRLDDKAGTAPAP